MHSFKNNKLPSNVFFFYLSVKNWPNSSQSGLSQMRGFSSTWVWNDGTINLSIIVAAWVSEAHVKDRSAEKHKINITALTLICEFISNTSENNVSYNIGNLFFILHTNVVCTTFANMPCLPFFSHGAFLLNKVGLVYIQ